MKASRPSTALKDTKSTRKDSKHILSRPKRPQTATSDSLKKIIQVIEHTLNKGAQTILTKINTKTWDRYSKIRYQPDFSQYRLPKQHSKAEREVSHFGTELIIHNSNEMHCNEQTTNQSSQKLIKSAKRIYPSYDNDQFVPYLLQNNAKEECQQPAKPQKYSRPLKKSSKQKKTTVFSFQKQNTEPIAPIDKWQNDSSLLNMSYLLKTD